MNRWSFNRSALLILDVVSIVVAFYASYLLRAKGFLFTGQPLVYLGDYFWLLFVAIVVYLGYALSQHVYRPLRLTSAVQVIQKFLPLTFIDAAVLSLLMFALKTGTMTSRYFVIVFVGLKFLFHVGIRLSYKSLSRTFRSRVYNFRRLLVITDSADPVNFKERLENDPLWNVAVVETIHIDTVDSIDLLGRLKDLAIDDCFLDCRPSQIERLAPLMRQLEERGVSLRLNLTQLGLAGARFDVEEMAGLPLLTFQYPLLTGEGAVAKRAMDVIFSTLGTVFTLILFPFVALAIKLDSQGPVLFRQTRIGQNGRRFRCYKFRTMTADADELKKELQSANEMQGPMFKIENDPRVTRVGRWLRKTSLDEFPQFINVLRGEMSLIGTRPPTPDELEHYRNMDFKRLSVKPGLTGLWQISGRSKINNFEEVVRLDLQYIDQWSLWNDVKIIFKTIWILLLRKGAA